MAYLAGKMIGRLLRSHEIGSPRVRRAVRSSRQADKRKATRDIRVGRRKIIYSGKTLGSRMGIGLFALSAVLLDIIHQLEKFSTARLQAHGRLIRDTPQLHGIIYYAAFYIFIPDSPDRYLAINPFVLCGCVVISQVGGRNFDRDQLGFIIIVAVQTGLQLPVSPVFQPAADQPVSVPVEDQYSHEQYSGNPLQGPQISNFFLIRNFFSDQVHHPGN